ncbi:unnamed protein product [marine sediment metagenome]|uniref:Uncharacterized protein n=1 Tax=marine sediment metagenome TaxID=412755 RepID=X1R3W4_9ZZZZ
MPILFYTDHIQNSGGDLAMAKIKKIKGKLGARVIKNKYLLPGGGINLIEKFPSYENKRKQKIKR